MANEEALVLDGLALNDGVTFGMLSFDAPVPRQRQDWIGAADSEAQLLVRDPLHDNRKITVRLAVVPQASMNVAHDKLLLVLDKLQKASRYTDGIAMTWTPATGTRTATFDVLSAEIVDLPVDWENGWLAFSPQFTVEMTAKPYWRGTETLTSTASSSTPFVTLEIAGVTGDVPALGRLIITDTASQSRRHVEWGLEGPLTYNASTSLIIDSDSMVTSGFTGVGNVVSGAYDPNASGNSAVTGNAVNAPTAIVGLGNQSHVGSFLVKARVRSDTTGGAAPTLKFRLTWRSADGPWTSNAWAEHTTGNATNQEVDLGTIIVPAATVGTHRWTGQIEALTGTAAYESATVDYVTLIPTSDGYGKARAVLAATTGTMTGFDDFGATTAGAALNARIAVAGGTWATSGSATDFVFADNLYAGTPADGIESIERSTIAVESPGRFAILGSTNYTDTQVDVRFVGSWNSEHGLIARWIDSSNYLRIRVPVPASTMVETSTFYVEQVVAGVVTQLGQANWSSYYSSIYRMRLLVYASGRVVASILSNDSTVLGVVEGSSTALATAGSLASGKPGLSDRATSASSVVTRRYTGFTVSTPVGEPIAIYSGRNMQIRHDDVIRQDSTGTYTGRPQSYRGSRFLVPVGTSRVLVKARRNDIETVADNNVTDATQVQIGWTPRGLAVPR